MGNPPEEVLGMIKVVARLAMGREHLRLYFTDRRVIVAHVSKHGGGVSATGAFLGGLSSLIEDFLRRPKRPVRKSVSSPEEILRWDKDNFDIPYSDVVSLYIHQQDAHSEIILVTQREKFQFEGLGQVTERTMRFLKTLLGPRMTAGSSKGLTRKE